MLTQYWRKSEVSFKRNRSDDEKYSVTIKLYKYDRDILNNLEVYKTHIDNDNIFAVVNMHKYECACNEAMDIIGKAEIIEPLELRQYVMERLNKIILNYN